jgi:hypothetical protein
MERWVVGNLEWSFGTRRYFGADNNKIRESLTVELAPTKAFRPKEGMYLQYDAVSGRPFLQALTE